MSADRQRATFGNTRAVTWVKVVLGVLGVLASGATSHAQQPALQISSPQNGSIVNPGQTLSVTVISPNGTTFSEVALLGPDPIGFNVVETSVPAQFSIAIPADASCRVYSLTADGITSSGQGSTSAPIQIDIERSDLPISLSTPGSDEILILESLGMVLPLKTLATFADGTILDVSESTLMSYTSTNTAVVTADTTGHVTAVGAGSAAVSMVYTQGGKSVQLTLQAQVLPQYVAVSPGSLTFSGQPTGTTSAAQAVTLTNSSSGSVGIVALSTTGDFSETDGCVASSPLRPGSSCTASVTFSPTAAGARSGTLSIANSTNVVPISMSLSGTATTAPAIISLSPTSGAVGSSVTISGANFGTTPGTSTVTFNGTTATPTSWSATSIVVLVPSAATTGNVVVTVGGQPSNGVGFTVTAPAPSITTLSQTSGAVGASITITGTNFGASQGTSTVTFNGTSAAPTSWSATSIAAPVPSGATTGNVVVKVSGQVSNGVNFTVVTAPSISNVSPASGSVGSSVTIAGTNFGASQGTSAVTFNGAAATPTSWSATSIVAPVPSGATTGNVVVTVGGRASNGVNFTVITPPTITTLTPSSGSTGASVTITGTNFGASQGTSTVTFNGTPVTLWLGSSWSASSIVVLVPSCATTGNVVVTVGGQASNGVSFTVKYRLGSC